MKKYLLTIGLLTALVVSVPVPVAHAMILDDATVASILGPKMPPSIVKVGTVVHPSYHSVQFFDNVANITNRVLDRSIRADIVFQQTNHQNHQVYVEQAKREQASVETHCQKRLVSENVLNAAGECGTGFVHLR